MNTYFSTFKDMYFTGDGCRVDADGDYWLLGRVDDVVNVSGHRIGTAEVESALVSHPKVAEAAVAPMPHDIKGQALYAFVTLKDGIAESEELKKELARTSARKSARLPCRIKSSSRPACRKRAPAKSCAASSAKLPRTRPTRSATSPRWPIGGGGGAGERKAVTAA